MCFWLNACADRYLDKLYNRLREERFRCHVMQADETPCLVNKDDRPAGSKSYMWVHTTSELDPDHPIIVFRFELTRKTDHLRAFYGDAGFTGTITSDCYCSYDILEKEYPDIRGSRCLMHARRNFYYAAMLVKAKEKPREELNELPEFKALILIDAINDADQPVHAVYIDSSLYTLNAAQPRQIDGDKCFVTVPAVDYHLHVIRHFRKHERRALVLRIRDRLAGKHPEAFEMTPDPDSSREDGKGAGGEE